MGPAYVPMISKLVGVCTALAIIRNGKVLLKERKDQYYQGWEAPGGAQGPGENYADAAKRHAKEEFGMEVRFIKILAEFDNPDNVRAHDHTVLLLCEPLSEPKDGEWLDKCPENMIPEHQHYRPVIDAYLAKSLLIENRKSISSFYDLENI